MSRGVTGLYSYPEKLHACRHETDTFITHTPFMEKYSILTYFSTLCPLSVTKNTLKKEIDIL